MYLYIDIFIYLNVLILDIAFLCLGSLAVIIMNSTPLRTPLRGEQLLRHAARSMCAVLRKEACASGALIGLPRFNNECAKVFVKMLVKVFVMVLLKMLYKKLYIYIYICIYSYVFIYSHIQMY